MVVYVEFEVLCAYLYMYSNRIDEGKGKTETKKKGLNWADELGSD